MWIEPGKDVSVADLHRGIEISSGNDAAVAVAEHLAGNESAFADMMNGYAEALGMTDSWFVNSHGLPDPDHRPHTFPFIGLVGSHISPVV